jgi:hypothetical protein
MNVANPIAVDFRADCLFVLRLGVGQPLQKIAEFVDAFGGRQMDPVVAAPDDASDRSAGLSFPVRRTLGAL